MKDYFMGLIIFSCSPKPKNTSNTAAIAEAFKNGFLLNEKDLVHIYYLCELGKWGYFRKVFEENNEFIFALPLFVECIPGLLMEFLETLNPKKSSADNTKIGFILQGGFEEACQLRTCEKYLEKLPSYLNCIYSGTLIKGGMFGLVFASEKSRARMLKPFFEMGKIYSKERAFEKTMVTKFAAPEKYSVFMLILGTLFFPINKIIWKILAYKLGARGKLDARPFET